MNRAIATVAFAIVTGWAATAHSTTIDLAHPTLAPLQDVNIGINVDRSIVFDVLTTFSITSAGIFFDPLTGGATAIAVDVYASNLALGGLSPHGALLATASTPIVDAGSTFYDVPIAFTFIPGNRYDLAFRSLNAGGWGIGMNQLRFYSFDFFVGNAAYSVGGLVSVLDGACHPTGTVASPCGEYTNRGMPNVRFNAEADAVPEPASLLLFGTGLAAAGIRRYRRKQ